MPIAQLVALTHGPAPAGMVAEPFGRTQIDPPWPDVAAAVGAMNDERFMVVVSARATPDVLFDPDALTIEFAAGRGYLLYQQAFTTKAGASAWRSQSAANVFAPNTLSLETVLAIVAAIGRGASFDEIAQAFPDA